MYKCGKFHQNRRWCLPGLVELTWNDPQAIKNMSTNATECMEEEVYNNTKNTAEGQIGWAQEE